jgi:hypothetical protein
MDEKFEPYEVPPTQWFGRRWDAPLLDGCVVEVPVPVGRSCLFCGEPIAAGDCGLMRLALGGTPEKPTASWEPAHMECDLRTMIGDVAHLDGQCRCSGAAVDEPEPAQSFRDEARAVLARVNQLRATQGRPPM